MNRLSWIGIVAVTAILSACGRPAQKTEAPSVADAPIMERAGPAKWNPATGGFELNGKALKTIKLWTFDGSTDGFTAVHSKIAPAAGQGLAIQIADPTIRSPKGLNVPGGQYPFVLVRLTRTAAGAAWDGALYYATAAHGETASFFGKPGPGAPPALGETVTLVYDMSHQAQGAPDWMQSTIDEIRLDIEDKAGGAFIIRQIAIAEDPNTPPPAAPPALPPPAPKS